MKSAFKLGLLYMYGAFGMARTEQKIAVYEGMISLAARLARLLVCTAQVEGQTMAYFDNQRADQPVVLFVHGFTGDKENWLMVAPKLTRDYRVIAVDLLGHGASDKPLGGDYAVTAQARRLGVLLNQLGIVQPVHVVGNSMGGLIAGYFAALFPEMTQTVTFIDSAGMPVHNAFSEQVRVDMMAGRCALVAEKIEDLDRLEALVSYKKVRAPRFLREALIARKIPNRAVYFNVLKAITNEDFDDFREPLVDVLPKITAPVLILWGKEDCIVSVDAVDVMLQYVHAQKVVVYEQVGHVPMIEAPHETARDLKAFFENNL
ncbi:Lipase 3 [Ephemeroptericola cinctiostellae]|uniref:Lipase 3 n=1 Tax=Ephemeroptericola cinctiostellae TaxID=2268024 RepID=A0A345DD86_9BURK|nr:alpha/beta fold hydrolase [Ephemeroptericola cinctiostellae]AXF86324.1 Lipase 3 [Ephemeroptericola cinctiostellae]